jgi:hypothetical protein
MSMTSPAILHVVSLVGHFDVHSALLHAPPGSYPNKIYILVFTYTPSAIQFIGQT